MVYLFLYDSLILSDLLSENLVCEWDGMLLCIFFVLTPALGVKTLQSVSFFNWKKKSKKLLCPSTPHFKWTAIQMARIFTSTRNPTIVGGQIVWVQNRASKWKSQLGKTDSQRIWVECLEEQTTLWIWSGFHMKEAPAAVTREKFAGFVPCCPWGNWLQDTVRTWGNSRSCHVFLWDATTIS